MNKLDKKIRKMAKRTECPVSRDYEERVEQLLKNLNGERGKSEKNHRFFMSRAGFAVCAICAIVLVTVPSVTAKVSNAVKERMESMSQKELDERLDAGTNPRKQTREHDTEALAFSRKWSKEEEERFNKLRGKYKAEGLFPEGELQIVDKLEENAEISSPVFEIWNREIFLPERELTDEELLQVIDYEYKEAYAIENSEVAKGLRTAEQDFNDNPNPGKNDLSEEEAISKASEYLGAMYDLDVGKMNKTTEFVMGNGSMMENGQYEYGEWEVIFKGEDEWSYVVNVSRHTGELVQINLCKEGYLYGSFGHYPVLIDEELYTSAYKKAKNIINNMTDAKIVKSTVGFDTPSDGYMEIVFYMDNHCSYQFQYITEDEVFSSMDVGKREYDEYLASSIGDYKVILME